MSLIKREDETARMDQDSERQKQSESNKPENMTEEWALLEDQTK